MIVQDCQMHSSSKDRIIPFKPLHLSPCFLYTVLSSYFYAQGEFLQIMYIQLFNITGPAGNEKVPDRIVYIPGTQGRHQRNSHYCFLCYAAPENTVASVLHYGAWGKPRFPMRNCCIPFLTLKTGSYIHHEQD